MKKLFFILIITFLPTIISAGVWYEPLTGNLMLAPKAEDIGLKIGTDVQAYDADLTTWAGITPGTGVGTALGINIGSAGAVVTNGGALGTPTSGNGSNITNVNAATLGGATFAAPGAIGGGTAAAGTFTTISAGATGFGVDADGDVTGKSFSTPQSAVNPDSNLLRGPGTNGRGVMLYGPSSEPANTYSLQFGAEPSVNQFAYIASTSGHALQLGFAYPKVTILNDDKSPTAAEMYNSLNLIATTGGIHLPTGVQGMHARFLAAAACSTGIHTPTGASIYLAGSAITWPNALFNTSAAIDDMIDLVCTSANTWRVIDKSGTWASQALKSFTAFQNFETATTGYDNSETWTESAEAGGVVEAADTTAPILLGSQQLKIYAGDSGSTSSSRTASLSAGSDYWAHVMIYSTNYGQINGTFLSLRDTATARCDIQINTDRKIRIYHGTGTTLSSAALTNSTAYHIWVHYIAGSGTDGQAYVYVSTTGTFPGSAFVSLATGGTSTTTVNKLYLQAVHQSTIFFDQAIMSTSEIGTVY